MLYIMNSNQHKSLDINEIIGCMFIAKVMPKKVNVGLMVQNIQKNI